MRKIHWLPAFLLLVCWAGCAAADAPLRRIEYYFQPDCRECLELKELFLPQLERECAGFYTLECFDLSEEKNFLRLLDRLDAAGDTSNEPVYMILDGRDVLGGVEEIHSRLIPLVRQTPTTEAEHERRTERRARFTVGAIALAGLVDGINPCVFATLVFFWSVLAGAGMARARLLAVGAVYCVAVFFTYLGLGAGLLQGLRFLAPLRDWVNAALVGVLALLALLSWRDAWSLLRPDGSARGVWLQLPERGKRLIHDWIRRLRARRFLLPGVFLLGMAVTLVESVCTGQVYVPTLAYLAANAGGVAKFGWWGALVWYNLAFILPLLVLLGLAAVSRAFRSAIHFSRMQAAEAKIAMGGFFCALALVLGFQEFAS